MGGWVERDSPSGTWPSTTPYHLEPVVSLTYFPFGVLGSRVRPSVWGGRTRVSGPLSCRPQSDREEWGKKYVIEGSSFGEVSTWWHSFRSRTRTYLYRPFVSFLLSSDPTGRTLYDLFLRTTLRPTWSSTSNVFSSVGQTLFLCLLYLFYFVLTTRGIGDDILFSGVWMTVFVVVHNQRDGRTTHPSRSIRPKSRRRVCPLTCHRAPCPPGKGETSECDESVTRRPICVGYDLWRRPDSRSSGRVPERNPGNPKGTRVRREPVVPSTPDSRQWVLRPSPPTVRIFWSGSLMESQWRWTRITSLVGSGGRSFLPYLSWWENSSSQFLSFLYPG